MKKGPLQGPFLFGLIHLMETVLQLELKQHQWEKLFDCLAGDDPFVEELKNTITVHINWALHREYPENPAPSTIRAQVIEGEDYFPLKLNEFGFPVIYEKFIEHRSRKKPVNRYKADSKKKYRRR